MRKTRRKTAERQRDAEERREGKKLTAGNAKNTKKNGKKMDGKKMKRSAVTEAAVKVAIESAK